MTLSKSSSEMSVTESYSGEEPALLTRMSTRPNRSYAASTSAVELGPVPGMDAERKGLPPGELGDLAGVPGAPVGIPAGDHHVGAGPGETFHHLPAQAAAAAGDQRHPPGEVEQRVNSMASSPGARKRAGTFRRDMLSALV